MCELLLEIPEVEKNGLIYIIGLGSAERAQWNIDCTSVNFAKQTMDTMPYRCVAIHHVVTWRMVELIVPFFLYLLKPRDQLRYRVYKQSTLLIDTLADCGIRKEIKEMLPAVQGGTDSDYKPRRLDRISSIQQLMINLPFRCDLDCMTLNFMVGLVFD
jgi:hypothetical protein